MQHNATNFAAIRNNNKKIQTIKTPRNSIQPVLAILAMLTMFGATGINAALLDVDGDGDLDAVTTEQRDRLGTVWYENPRQNRTRGGTP